MKKCTFILAYMTHLGVQRFVGLIIKSMLNLV